MANKPALTGLEAIKFMEQGGVIVEKDSSNPNVLRIENGVMWVKNSKLLNGNWIINTNFDLSLEYEEYVEPKVLTGWERASNKHDEYFCIGHCGDIRPYSDDFLGYDRTIYNIANYFSTKEKAEEINFKQTLFRRLQRFSDENGGNEIDWKIDRQAKWCIEYNNDNGEIVIVPFHSIMQFGQVYFTSHEVAEQAIQLFHDDLIKYFTTHD